MICPLPHFSWQLNSPVILMARPSANKQVNLSSYIYSFHIEPVDTGSIIGLDTPNTWKAEDVSSQSSLDDRTNSWPVPLLDEKLSQMYFWVSTKKDIRISWPLYYEYTINIVLVELSDLGNMLVYLFGVLRRPQESCMYYTAVCILVTTNLGRPAGHHGGNHCPGENNTCIKQKVFVPMNYGRTKKEKSQFVVLLSSWWRIWKQKRKRSRKSLPLCNLFSNIQHQRRESIEF